MQIKTNPRQWIHLCVFLLLLLPALTMQGGTVVTIGDLRYELDTETKTASVYSPKSLSTTIQILIIPEEITWNGQTYLVTSIGSNAFYHNSSVTELTLPNSLTSIGDYAFSGCIALAKLTLPNSLTSIGDYAFSFCSGLTELTLPNYLTSIGNHAFSECTGVLELTLPNSLTSIGPWAFYACSGLTELILPNSLTSIGDYAFNSCIGLTGSLTIPNSVITIGSNAFLNCSGFTGSLIIGNSVATIGSNAFDNCSGFTGMLNIPSSVTTIESRAFESCSGFTNLQIGSGVTDIGFGAFGFTNFNDITTEAIIPPSIIVNGSYTTAFTSTSYSKPLYVPAESLEAYKTAYEWKEFTQINPIGGVDAESIALDRSSVYLEVGDNFTLSATVLPEDTTDKSVAWTSSDEDVVSVTEGKVTAQSAGVATITATTLNGLSATCQVTVMPSSPFTFTFDVTTKTATVTGLKSSITSLQDPVIPDVIPNKGDIYNVTAIKDRAFPNSIKISGTLTIGKNITAIGANAFSGCSKLTGSLNIPNSVITIGNYAFNSCNGFTGSLTIGDSVTTIGEKAFYSCTGFTGSLTIGNSVITIGENAFYSCKGFTGSLTIPNSVTTIGQYAFYGCSGFNGELTLSEQLVELGSYAFYSCSNLSGTIRIPESLTTISSRAFENCAKIEHIVFPSTMTSIAAYSFHGCKGLQSVTCYALTPPELPTSRVQVGGDSWYPSYTTYWAFENSVAANTYLYVESESLDLYKKHSLWQKFKFASIDPDGITLDRESVSLHPSEQLVLTATITPDDASDKSVAWTSSDEAVASVVDGVVTANGWGTATITATTINGLSASCEVTVWLMGDVNNDGVINVGDVSLTSSYIAGLEPENFSVEAADINGDGDITVTDAVLIARLILNAESVSAQSVSRVRSFAMENGIMNVNRNGEMISLSLPKGGYTALQADLRLPEGVSPADVTLCENYANSHVMMTADKGNNIVRLVVFSVNNAEFSSGEDIVRIALPNSSAGLIEGFNIVAADADGTTSYLSLSGDGVVNGVATISGSNEVSITPIGGGVIVSGATQQSIRCFTVDGLPVKSVIAESDNVSISLATGIYIINVGTKTQKVIIK